jgi:threonine/homoserine/homoserine lactone efflux protein
MLEQVTPFILFAFVISITPGPTNVMVSATGASHGVRAAAPVILGACLGVVLIILLVGLGLAEPLTAYPDVHHWLAWAGSAWLAVLAWKIANAPVVDQKVLDGRAKPAVGFMGAAVFQLMNPKAWMMAVAVITTFTNAKESLHAQVVLLSLVFLAVAIPSVTVWAFMGAGAGRFLNSRERMILFNRGMGLLLLASIIPTLIKR